MGKSPAKESKQSTGLKQSKMGAELMLRQTARRESKRIDEKNVFESELGFVVFCCNIVIIITIIRCCEAVSSAIDMKNERQAERLHARRYYDLRARWDD